MDCRTARDRAIAHGELIFTTCVPEIMYEFLWTDREKGKGHWRYYNGKYWVYVDEQQVMIPTYDTSTWGSHPKGTDPRDVLATLDEERVLKYTLFKYPVGQISTREV